MGAANVGDAMQYLTECVANLAGTQWIRDARVRHAHPRVQAWHKGRTLGVTQHAESGKCKGAKGSVCLGLFRLMSRPLDFVDLQATRYLG